MDDLLPDDGIATPETPAEPLTLRETLSTVVEAKKAEVDAPEGESAEQKAGRLANRQRDDKGRVLPGKPNVAAAGTLPHSSGPASPLDPLASQPAATPTLKRPDSWKKEHWERWDKLAAFDPEVAKYIIQREGEASNGVGMYRQQAEQGRQLNEAMAPFMQNLQQHGIEPSTFIRNLGNAHQKLATGSPQEKVLIGAQLIKDYGIDVQGLYNVFTNPQFAQQLQNQQPQQPQFDQRTIDTAVQRKLDEAFASREVQSEYERFTSAKDDTGNLKYPHVETVKQSMAGLLQAGLAHDYQSAYDAAVRLPQHSEIFQAMQEQHRQQADQTARAASQAAVARARANTVSTRSSAPGTARINGQGNSVRELLRAAMQEKSARV